MDLFAQQFEDKNIILLIIAATVYLVFSLFSSDVSAYVQVLTIYVGVVLATSVGAMADHHQNKSFLGIRDEINNAKVIVFRGPYGQQLEISVKDIVVGDVIQITQGDVIPADCMLLEEMNIRVDESIYGNPAYVEKGSSKRFY
jgi:magnesium-transporting ATPase (P-type)